MLELECNGGDQSATGAGNGDGQNQGKGKNGKNGKNGKSTNSRISLFISIVQMGNLSLTERTQQL